MRKGALAELNWCEVVVARRPIGRWGWS